MPLERISIDRYLNAEFLGSYCGVWIHETLHGLPSLLLIGPWGMGKDGSGIPIAFPAIAGPFGFFIPNPFGWYKYLSTLDTSSAALFILMTSLAPYTIHFSCFFAERTLKLCGHPVKSTHGFLHSLWKSLSVLDSSMIYDLCVAVLFIVIYFVKY